MKHDADVDPEFFRSKLRELGDVALERGNEAVVRLVNHYWRLSYERQSASTPIWLREA